MGKILLASILALACFWPLLDSLFRGALESHPAERRRAIDRAVTRTPEEVQEVADRALKESAGEVEKEEYDDGFRTMPNFPSWKKLKPAVWNYISARPELFAELADIKGFDEMNISDQREVIRAIEGRLKVEKKGKEPMLKPGENNLEFSEN